MFFAGKRPSLGVQAGKLTPCLATPNCVCSQSENAVHAIEPIAYTSSRAVALATLKQVVQSLPKTQIIQESEDYLYAEFASALLGFVDDVEFYLPPQENIIHVRSASRLGKSDLGVNRKRIELIRAKFSELHSA